MQVRPPVPGDAPALFALGAAFDTAELGYVDYELADAVAELSRPGLDPALDAWVVPDGDTLLGYAAVHGTAGTEQVAVELYVHPAGPAAVYAELLGRIRRRAGELARAGGYPAVVLSAYAAATASSRHARELAADGWRPVRRFARMRIDAADLGGAPDLPPGVRVSAGEAAAESAVHAVLTAAFAEHFGHRAESLADWQVRQRARAGYDRDLWFLASAHGEPAAALLGLRMAEQGWVAALGVLPGHRGRGLGRLLLRTAFAAFGRLGYTRVELGVDTANATGAYRLYESVGMSLAAAHDCWQLRVPGEPATAAVTG